jgi:ADP-ribosyl-[dinitrogen reductase] hydrolase
MKGSCRCGAVSYELDRLDSLGHCHCVTCRKTHSAAFATTGRVTRESFRWITGEDNLHCGETPAESLR